MNGTVLTDSSDAGCADRKPGELHCRWSPLPEHRGVHERSCPAGAAQVRGGQGKPGVLPEGWGQVQPGGGATRRPIGPQLSEPLRPDPCTGCLPRRFSSGFLSFVAVKWAPGWWKEPRMILCRRFKDDEGCVYANYSAAQNCALLPYDPVIIPKGGGPSGRTAAGTIGASRSRYRPSSLSRTRTTSRLIAAAPAISATSAGRRSHTPG